MDKNIEQKERVRRSYNKHKVNNPFDDDRFVAWDGFLHPIRAHSYAILEEYLADKYLKEQGLRIMNEMADTSVKEENVRRRTSNQLPLDRTRKTGEQLEFETPFYNDPSIYTEDTTILSAAQGIPTDREKMIFVIVKQYGLYGGMSEEFGMDYLPTTPTNAPISVSIIEALGTAPQAPRMAPEHEGGKLEGSVIDDLQSKDVFTLRKIAKEKGLETHNTDKKAELIAKIQA